MTVPNPPLARAVPLTLLGMGMSVAMAAATVLVGAACARGMRTETELFVPPVAAPWTGRNRLPSYRFGSPGAAWEPMTDKGLQVAWHHDADPAVIQLFGECENHGDSDLEDFTDHQRIDYASWAIVEEPTGELDAEGRPRMRPMQYYTTVAGREALRTTVRANLDGVEVMVEYVVVKKDGCLFDLTYIAKPDDFAAHTDDFQKVIDGFTYPVRR